MTNKCMVLILLLLGVLAPNALKCDAVQASKEEPVAVVQNVKDDDGGKEMPTIVTQTFDDITQDPQDFIKEDDEEIEDNDEEEVEGKYEDEFDNDSASAGLEVIPDGRRQRAKQVSWYQQVYEKSVGFLTGFRA